MSKIKIEKPKVFISYAWGTEEYQNKVLEFATQLMGDGIEVVLDKWDLSEGNDTYAFMEKCATDESITNVLMLIDPIYAEKADLHSGGVGTETQIISPKVYDEVEQDKFIPIVFERDEKGTVCKPTYLQGRLHFDLSIDEKYDDEYLRLVKTLYGVKVFKKPQLGNKPLWVENESGVEVEKKRTFERIKNIYPEKARELSFSQQLEYIIKKIENVLEEGGMIEFDDVIPTYEKFNGIKTEYLMLLNISMYVEDAEKIIANKLENIALVIKKYSGRIGELGAIFLHEMFVYTVAFFLKSEDYVAVGNILGKTYYNPQNRSDKVSGFDLFYSGHFELMNRAMNDRDNKEYISGTAEYWIENIVLEYVTKEQLVLADLICFNYSIYGKDNLLEWEWFPITYIYDNEYASAIGKFSKKMVSKEYLEDIIPIFGYTKIEEFKEKMVEITSYIKQGSYRNIKYNSAWHSAGVINYYIDIDNVGKYR